jgi:hypothetical protein
MLNADDERAITAVIMRYATGIDRRNWELFRTCFTEDVRAEYGSFGTWTSAAEITTFMEQAHAALGATLHRMSNVVIEARAEGAVVRSYVDALLMPGAAGGEPHRGIGYYDDEFVRTPQGWRIRRRLFVAVKIV